MPEADEIVQAEVLTGWRTSTGTHMAAVRLTLLPGWKTYWRSPGAAGIPPQFDWSGSKNLTGVRIHWPRPEVFLTSGARTLGYAKELVLPIELSPRKHGKGIRLSAELNLGVCDEICVPATVSLSADINGKGESDRTIQAALAQRPIAAAKAGVGKVVCMVEPISDGLQVTTRITMPRLGVTELAVIEAGDPTIWVSEPEVTRVGATLVAVADFVPPKRGGYVLDRSALRITVLSGSTAIDIRGCSAN